MLEDLIRTWDGEEVVVGYDEPSGTWMFVCIHSTRLGPAGGGTRMKPYAQPSDALRDARKRAARSSAFCRVLPPSGSRPSVNTGKSRAATT